MYNMVVGKFYVILWKLSLSEVVDEGELATS